MHVPALLTAECGPVSRQPAQSSGLAGVSRTTSISRSPRNDPTVRESRLNGGEAFVVGVIVNDAHSLNACRVPKRGGCDLQVAHTHRSSLSDGEQSSL